MLGLLRKGGGPGVELGGLRYDRKTVMRSESSGAGPQQCSSMCVSRVLSCMMQAMIWKRLRIILGLLKPRSQGLGSAKLWYQGLLL